MKRKPNWIDESLLKYWKRITERLDDADLYSDLDDLTIVQLCRIEKLIEDATYQLGTNYITDEGKPNPLLKVIDDAQKSFITIAKELGLTLSSRQKNDLVSKTKSTIDVSDLVTKE